MVQGDEQVLIAQAQQGGADLGIALGHIGLELDLLDQGIELGVADLAEIEVAVGAIGACVAPGLHAVERVVGGDAPAQHEEGRLEALEGLAVGD